MLAAQMSKASAESHGPPQPALAAGKHGRDASKRGGSASLKEGISRRISAALKASGIITHESGGGISSRLPLRADAGAAGDITLDL